MNGCEVDDLRKEGPEAGFAVVDRRGEGLDGRYGRELAAKRLREELANLVGREFRLLGEKVGELGKSGLESEAAD